MTDHKIIAAHFSKTNEAMRKLRKSGSGLYDVYVKAYKWDTRHLHHTPYLVCDADRYNTIKPDRVTKLDGGAEVCINETQHRVGLKRGGQHFIQQFGRLDRAVELYERIKNEKVIK